MLLRDQFARLVPAFRQNCLRLLEKCEEKGVTMYPNELIRSPQTQARLWCRGRSPATILQGITSLEMDGASFLASCLQRAAAANNSSGAKIVTNALPGLSWHQWGEAMDCCWLVDGRPEWNTCILKEGGNGYVVYGEEATKLGLDAGYLWASKDAAHVQYRKDASPLAVFTMREIDREMKARYGTPA
jgi:peptidoglycan L-alanyl-D-glutamate endopeptidase CwlK